MACGFCVGGSGRKVGRDFGKRDAMRLKVEDHGR